MAKAPNWCILDDTQHPLRARVLAIMMFIPFKAETELPIKQCVSKEPPLVLCLPQPELVYSTGNILKNTAKQPTTTYITKWHNNLCKASQNCGLGYILLHFSPTMARHNPDVVKMPVNKMVLTRRHPSGGSLLRHGQQQTKEYKSQLLAKEVLFNGFIKKKCNKDSYSFFFFS